MCVYICIYIYIHTYIHREFDSSSRGRRLCDSPPACVSLCTAPAHA